MGNGQEESAPSAFIFVTVLYALFALGYIAMARRFTATGGFYAFISHGLGRVVALAAGFAMMASYCIFAAELMGGAAAFAQIKFNGAGIHASWLVWGLLGIALISALGWFDVRLTVKVLGTALILEMALILIFTIAVFVSGGNGGVSLTPINPAKIFTGVSPGIGIFFAIISWVGTETVVDYAEESRNPRRIVPLGTLLAMIGVGVFYTFACWAFVTSYGPHNEAFQALSTGTTTVFGHKQAITATNSVTVPVNYFVGHAAEEAVSILIITSSLACGLALNNVCVRYIYALGREGIISPFLGRTHPKHKTPYVAVAVEAAVLTVIILAFYLGNATPFDVYAWLGIPALALLMGTQVLCSIATIVYFARHHEVNFITTLVAPLLAAAGLTFALYLLFHKLTFVAGVSNTFVSTLPWITLAIPLLGIGYALWLRARQPKKYEVLGRMVNEGTLL